MQRADLTTRGRSRHPCPSPRVDLTSRRPRVGSCDHDRHGRYVRARCLARGSRRWVIRWAKPGRIGPYEAQPRAFLGATVCSDLQAFRCSEAPRTPRFTRERSQVRNPPRSSSEGRYLQGFCGSSGTRKLSWRAWVRAPLGDVWRRGRARARCCVASPVTREVCGWSWSARARASAAGDAAVHARSARSR
jgi:hypothetical protein